ncbi:glutathione S-transferase [Stella humosa]|uniref:Glutathione S-transferase n=1 Tax=Stella humosa TaxID=94 RepID=A0A3N1KQ55_9PROT|nr:glutathione S-transferase family protein [Stella humosa]ROP83923.1 glutathione S-transferase [Stella humosa]BBK32815.1 glutathione S-transferase [Stella humosa]
MLTLWGNLDSGNVYKVRLLWSWLGLAHRRVDVAQTRGEPSTAAFRVLNPIGKVPAVQLEDGRLLAESGAILQFFANGTRYWPDAAWDQAEVLRWMFFEQYSHEPYIAVNRYLLAYAPSRDAFDDERVRRNHPRGVQALAVMEERLGRARWLVGDAPTIADIALYAYTHVAAEGGFSLDGMPGIARWMARLEALPGHIGLLQESAVEVVGFSA